MTEVVLVGVACGVLGAVGGLVFGKLGDWLLKKLRGTSLGAETEERGGGET